MGLDSYMMKGKQLEKRANYANFQARQAQSALILQIPTPLILTKKGVIPKESTVDFAGILKGGRFIAFDAKETRSKTSFPLANIKQHQLNYLNMVSLLGGIAFFMIQFVLLYPDSAFCVPSKYIQEFIETKKRKSIPIKSFDKKWLIKIDNYIEEVQQIYEYK